MVNASVSWNPSPNANSYSYELWDVNNSILVAQGVTTNTSITFNNLFYDYDYEFKIITECENLETSIEVELAFTTPQEVIIIDDDMAFNGRFFLNAIQESLTASVDITPSNNNPTSSQSIEVETDSTVTVPLLGPYHQKNAVYVEKAYINPDALDPIRTSKLFMFLTDLEGINDYANGPLVKIRIILNATIMGDLEFTITNASLPIEIDYGSVGVDFPLLTNSDTLETHIIYVLPGFRGVAARDYLNTNYPGINYPT